MSDQPETVAVTIDGRHVAVPKGTLVIRAAERLHVTIPRFCDHPLLDPAGSCRQCYVEIEGQRKLFMACTTECTDGMVVHTHRSSELARAGQFGTLELLLINHPLDCPQCDKGGECPLQDQDLSHGPGDSRFIEPKRRYVKPIPISAQVLLDRERCVLCARCTRFAAEIAGDPLIELFERTWLEQVAIEPDEPYDSYFSGNVVQICPVGALTAASYRFRARPFDVQSHHGICNHCSAGYNLRLDVRNGRIERQLAGENMAVNEMWNCDKGRFGFTYVAHPDRLRLPQVRDGLGRLEPVSWPVAVRPAADTLQAALDAGGPDTVGVITGGRLTDEDAYALSRFARDVLGTDNVNFRLSPRTAEERDVLAAVAGTVGPTYDDVEHAGVVVVAGLDPEDEVPIQFLRLRKAWRQRRQRIVVVGPGLGSLAEIAWRWLPTPVHAEAAVLDALRSEHPTEALTDVADALHDGGRVVVLAGERLAQSPGALPAAAELARHLDAGFAWMTRRAGARGNLDAGLLPGLLPGGRRLDDPGPLAELWDRLPERTGLDTRQMLAAAADGTLTALYLVGVDLARDFEDPRLADAALRRVDTLIVQDLLPTATTRHADVILPACAPAERVGSFTTWEGRRQPFPQAVPAQGMAQWDWDITRQIARALGRDLGWETAADVRREAAPVMAASQRPLDRLPAQLAHVQTPAEPPPPDADEFDAVVIDWLLGHATMLLGAEELTATGRPATVWVNRDDARRLGISDGQPLTVTGPGGRTMLPARVTAAVTAGCVVLPRNSTDQPTSCLSRTDTPSDRPLRVRLERHDDQTASDRPLPGEAARGHGARQARTP